jgi:hypothetical protein
MNKSRGRRLLKHVACTGFRNSYEIVIRKPKGRDHSEDLDIDGLGILRWILGK